MLPHQDFQNQDFQNQEFQNQNFQIQDFQNQDFQIQVPKSRPQPVVGGRPGQCLQQQGNFLELSCFQL